MNIRLTSLQSFSIIQEFLEEYFKETSSDSLGALLSCMDFLEDGQTADPVLWEDWKIILDSRNYITAQEAFEAMSIFLNKYYRGISSDVIKKLLKDLDEAVSKGFENKVIWNKWMTRVDHFYEAKT